MKGKSFMIYPDFESILTSEDHGKKNPNEFSKPFKSYFGENAVYNFINSMIEESKYCSEVIK